MERFSILDRGNIAVENRKYISLRECKFLPRLNFTNDVLSRASLVVVHAEPRRKADSELLQLVGQSMLCLVRLSVLTRMDRVSVR